MTELQKGFTDELRSAAALAAIESAANDLLDTILTKINAKLASVMNTMNAAVTWYPSPGVAPELGEENGERVWLFAAAASQQMALLYKVPQSYIAGKQIQFRIGQYSPSASGTQLLQSTAYLIRNNVDAVDSTTNSHASVNTALTNAVANRYREAILDITDASGLINSVAVSAGDLVRVILQRGTDTDTAAIRFMASATEPRFVI